MKPVEDARGANDDWFKVTAPMRAAGGEVLLKNIWRYDIAHLVDSIYAAMEHERRAALKEALVGGVADPLVPSLGEARAGKLLEPGA